MEGLIMHNSNVPEMKDSDINSSVGFSDTIESRNSRNISSPFNNPSNDFSQDSSLSLEVSSKNPLLRFHLDWIQHCRNQIKNLKLDNNYGFWKSIITDCIEFHNKRIMEILVDIGTTKHPYPEEDLTGRLSLYLPREVLNKYLHKEK